MQVDPETERAVTWQLLGFEDCHREDRAVEDGKGCSCVSGAEVLRLGSLRPCRAWSLCAVDRWSKDRSGANMATSP